MQRRVWTALAPLSTCGEHLTGWQPWTVIRALAFHAVFGAVPRQADVDEAELDHIDERVANFLRRYAA